MKVIGLGVGRTGTYSLKKALERLGLGPCHHMEEVLHHMPEQVPLWAAAADGRPDWDAIYKGYESAVDWPTAGFTRELAAEYPSARFILTVRSPESWAESFSETIGKVMAMRAQLPPEMQDWLSMGERVISGTGFPDGMSVAELAEAFQAHTERVKATVPADQLLIYEVRQGWEPLCEFLGQPVPDEAFPRTNSRIEFWDRLSGPPPRPRQPWLKRPDPHTLEECSQRILRVLWEYQDRYINGQWALARSRSRPAQAGLEVGSHRRPRGSSSRSR